MRIFITGITGTLGTTLAKLHHCQGDQVWGCARNESRAVEWLRSYGYTSTLFVGDASRLADLTTDMGRLLPSLERVYHCAAMKHVDICERQPTESVAQNVTLTKTLATACKWHETEFILISSDKACLPQGVYGATKLLAERVALQEGAAVVRLGNLIGSSGSVFHLWKNLQPGEPIKVTNRKMTRYFIPVENAAKFISSQNQPGLVVIPNPLPAVEMGEVADAIAKIKSSCAVEIGNRLAETQHQWLVAPQEPYTISEDKSKLVLTKDGYTSHSGLCSHTAPRWDVEELLVAAGIISERTI